ncbi:MAG: hypothetical protein KAS04_04650, partial [Candidatus Aenigmarchaeota archaeon]|nr:hypothetical protein [Candidatus Aenigmarchaeota archaeon]
MKKKIVYLKKTFIGVININTDFLITYRDYELSNNSVIFRLFGRDAEGNRVIKHVSGTKPYLYVPEADNIVPDSRVTGVQSSRKPSIFKQKVKQIFVTKPGDVAGSNEEITYIRDMYDKTFEADILYDYRCAIDHELNGIVSTPSRSFLNLSDISPSSITNIETRKITFDIENEDNGTIAEAKNGEKEVYVITLHDSKENIYHIFSSFILSQAEMDKVSTTIYNHWKDNKYYPELSTSTLSFHFGLDESELFNNFFTFIEQNPPDILSGYNTNGYDIPVICERAKKLGIDSNRLSEVKKVSVFRDKPRVSGVACMDVQDLYKDFIMGTVLYPSLEYVSTKELETSKLPRTSIIELYQTDRAHLVAYNIIDVQLTVAIEKKYSLIDLYKELSIEAYTSFEENNVSVLIDNLILHEVKNEFVLPTKKKRESAEKKKKEMRGGIVYEVIAGMHKNVIVLDFKGMYPSIIIALNISPDTKDKNGTITAANGIRFATSPAGVIPRILKKLKDKRNRYKTLKKDAEHKYSLTPTPIIEALVKQYDLKQQAIKKLQNAFYGVMGFGNFRLKDPEMGDAITSTGQYLSKESKSHILGTDLYYKDEQIVLKVIYGDTDSLFIKIIGDHNPYELRDISAILRDEINSNIDILMKEVFNVTDHEVEIEDDKIFQKLFQVKSKKGKGAKKRYVGLTYNFNEDGKYIGTKEVTKGFEIVRAGSSKLTKDVQKHILFNLILTESKRSEVSAYLKQVEIDFFNDVIPISDIGIRVPLNKPLSSYGDIKTINALRNAKHYLHREIEPGYVGTYYTVSKSPRNLPNHSVIALDFDEELPEGYEINKKATWEKAVTNPLKTILEAYDMSWDYVETGTIEKKLTELFKK